MEHSIKYVLRSVERLQGGPTLRAALIFFFAMVVLGVYLRHDSPWLLGQWLLRDIERSLDLVAGHSSALAGPEMNNGARLPGPLLYLILSFSTATFKSLESVFYLNISLNVLSALILTLSIFRHFGTATAVIFATLLLTNSLHIQSAAWPINPSFLFIFISIILSLAMEGYFRKKAVFFVGALVVTGLAAQVHISAVLLFIPLSLFIYRSSIFTIRHAFISVVFLTATLLPYVFFLTVYDYPIAPSELPFWIGGYVNTMASLLLISGLTSIGLLKNKHLSYIYVNYKYQIILSFFSSMMFIVILFIFFDQFVYGLKALWWGFKDLVEPLGPEYVKGVIKAINQLQEVSQIIPRFLDLIVFGASSIHFFMFDDMLTPADFYFQASPYLESNESALNEQSKFLIKLFLTFVWGSALSVYAYYCKFGKPQAGQRARLNFACIAFLGPFLPAWLFFGTGFTAHRWYSFVHLPSAILLFSHALAVTAAMSGKFITSIFGTRLPVWSAFISTITLVSYLSYSLDKNLTNSYELKASEIRAPQNLLSAFQPRLDSIQETIRAMEAETGVTSADLSTRTTINILSLDQLSDVLFDNITKGKLTHYSRKSPSEPALYQPNLPCLFIQTRNLTNGERERFFKFEKSVTILSRRQTATFDIIEYAPNFSDFCYTNSRAMWLQNVNQEKVRSHLDRSQSLAAITDIPLPLSARQAVGQEWQFALMWDELELPFFLKFKFERAANGEVDFDAVLDSDMLAGENVIIWKGNQYGKYFSNAYLRIIAENETYEYPFVGKGKNEHPIFVRDENCNVEYWLSYFPIRMRRKIERIELPIGKMELRLEAYGPKCILQEKVFELNTSN